MAYIGAHVSIAGGIQNSPYYGYQIECECIQIFTRSPQGGKAFEITQSMIDEFYENKEKYNIKNVYVHSPYYINLASSDNKIKYNSAKVIKEELQRSSLIKAKYMMVHVGTAKDLGQQMAIKQVIEMLKKSLDGYNGYTQLLLENSAGSGQIIGDDLKELNEIINEVSNDFLIGICLDTQHSWASGYDWRDFKNTINRIDKEVGLNKIKLLHINDSMSDFDSHKDRHANIGKGLIPLQSFDYIVKFAEDHDIDMICETPYEDIYNDIKILKSFRK